MIRMCLIIFTLLYSYMCTICSSNVMYMSDYSYVLTSVQYILHNDTYMSDDFYIYSYTCTIHCSNDTYMSGYSYVLTRVQ